MELALVAVLIVIYTEFREYRWREHMKTMDAHYRGLRMSEHVLARRVDALDKAIEKSSALISAMAERAEKQSVFIDQAATDLSTLIKEYEINGVPMGLDRSGGKKADFYEVGL